MNEEKCKNCRVFSLIVRILRKLSAFSGTRKEFEVYYFEEDFCAVLKLQWVFLIHLDVKIT